MPDIPSGTVMTEDVDYLTVEDIAYHTGRSAEMIRRYIRDRLVPSIPDPDDGRRRLVPDTSIPTILRQRQRGTELRRVTLTLSDGTQITRRVRTKRA